MPRELDTADKFSPETDKFADVTLPSVIQGKQNESEVVDRPLGLIEIPEEIFLHRVPVLSRAPTMLENDTEDVVDAADPLNPCKTPQKKDATASIKDAARASSGHGLPADAEAVVLAHCCHTLCVEYTLRLVYSRR